VTPLSRRSVRDRPLVLSIGVTDPYVAAGVSLDLFVADRLDVRPVMVVVGVSAQDGGALFRILPIDAALIREQLAALVELPIAAVRIGAIASDDAITEVARFLRRLDVPVVLDPVIASTSGGRFLDDAVLEAYVERLFPLATLVTPNLPEAMELLGMSIATLPEMAVAALALTRRGARAVLLKGGHGSDPVVDVFCDGYDVRHFEAARLSGSMRGTGCLLAFTIAAALAHGYPLRTAIQSGRDIVQLLIPVARLCGRNRVVP